MKAARPVKAKKPTPVATTVPEAGEGKRGEEGYLAYLLRQGAAAVRLRLERALADLGVRPVGGKWFVENEAVGHTQRGVFVKVGQTGLGQKKNVLQLLTWRRGNNVDAALVRVLRVG